MCARISHARQWRAALQQAPTGLLQDRLVAVPGQRAHLDGTHLVQRDIPLGGNVEATEDVDHLAASPLPGLVSSLGFVF
jgi:hypothetical protein